MTKLAFQRLEPFGTQHRGSLRKFLVEELSVCDPVQPKMAEILAEFAPADQEARTVEIADRDRPDHPLGFALLDVTIGDCHLAARTDPGTGQARVEPIRRNILPARNRPGRRIEQQGAQMCGYGRRDLGDQILRGAGEPRIAMTLHPLRAEHRSLQLVGCQHQWR